MTYALKDKITVFKICFVADHYTRITIYMFAFVGRGSRADYLMRNVAMDESIGGS